jgi:hypothetical protein
MEKFTSELLKTLHVELQVASSQANNNLQQFDRSYHITVQKINQLKEFMQSYTFKNREEEIRFFKEIKPSFQKEAIYYSELFIIEAEKPMVSEENQKNYYAKVFDRLALYFDQNREFFNYYRAGKDSMDESYFLRNAVAIPLREAYALDLDTNFSTLYSQSLAHFQAYEQLCAYLTTSYYRKGDLAEAVAGKEKDELIWTATDVALVETGAALYYGGAINHGTGGLRKVISGLEAVFNVKTGNTSRVLLGMSLRKKDLAPFLRRIMDTFIRKAEEKFS